MGRLKDYINMAKEGLKNPTNVIEGNVNGLLDKFGLLDEETKTVADKRYEICHTCPFNSINATKVGFYKVDRVDEHCSLCLCPIKAKVMSMESQCGLDRLAETFNENNVKTSGLDGYKILWGKHQ